MESDNGLSILQQEQGPGFEGKLTYKKIVVKKTNTHKKKVESPKVRKEKPPTLEVYP